MNIVLVGGGSGGHLTPLIAVGAALKARDSSLQVIHIGQKGENLQEVVDHPGIDVSYQIRAGKFRRYHGESFISHLLDVRTLLLNVRDFFLFVAGTAQAWRLLGKLRPGAVFLKGGFVSVPVGFAARLRRIPYITHDSDAVPGLANRLTAGKARYNTTALPTDIYPYDADKVVQVGVPLQPEFQKVSEANKKRAKQALDLDPKQSVVLSVGGGLGADNLNQAIVAAMPDILAHNPKLTFIHLTGKKLHADVAAAYEKVLNKTQLQQVQVIDFSTKLYALSAAADVVITRAGATNMAEFATQAKPCIVVPAPHLTGGQQLHNAKVLAQAKAVVVLQEDELEHLAPTLQDLLTDQPRQAQLSQALHSLAVPHAADTLSQLLIELAVPKG